MSTEGGGGGEGSVVYYYGLIASLHQKEILGLDVYL